MSYVTPLLAIVFAEPVSLLATVLLAIVCTELLSLLATVVYVLVRPGAWDRLNRAAEQMQRTSAAQPHADGQPCPGQGCERCARYERKARRHIGATLRLYLHLSWELPAALFLIHGPRAGRWLLHGNGKRNS